MSAKTETAAEWVAVDALVPWDKNPRKITAAHVKQVADSITRFGFSNPILARRADGMVIAGHTRLEAARALGIAQVPVRYMDLDPSEARLLALADNKLAESGEWDEATLAELLGPLMMEHADVAEVAGFSDEEIARLLKSNADLVIEAADDQSESAKTDFVVLVECSSEEHQRRLIERLMGEGLTVRALT